MEAKSLPQRKSRGMPLQFVNHVGHPMNVDALMLQEAALAEAQKPRKGGAAKLSRTLVQFEVWGIKVSLRDKAAARAAEKRSAWEALPEKVRAKRAEPPMWDEQAWLQEKPLKRAMRHGYDVKSSAELAAQMLGKQGGWLRLTVLQPGAVVAK